LQREIKAKGNHEHLATEEDGKKERETVTRERWTEAEGQAQGNGQKREGNGKATQRTKEWKHSGLQRHFKQRKDNGRGREMAERGRWTEGEWRVQHCNL
jgi:hypothetical protein